MRYRVYGLAGAVAALVAGVIAITQPFSEGDASLLALARQNHFHGIAADPIDASRFYLATHYGLYLAGSTGQARRVSETFDDFMGFTPHPKDRSAFFASGHLTSGRNLGLIISKDGGKSWSDLFEGFGSPVDFHQLVVSKADSTVIFGVYRGLLRSPDGGQSWTRIGQPPEGLNDLAASGRDTKTLYAATERGLLRSTDAGETWHSANLPGQPATMVQTTQSGGLFAFVAGSGLFRAREDDLSWRPANDSFGADDILHLASDPTDDRRLYAVTVNRETREQAVRTSRDGGVSWVQLGTK